MIIHISGFSGSGKSTLGEKLQSIYGNKVVVYDTDEFIQHHTKEGKQLLKIESEIEKGTKTSKDHKILWKKTIKNKINEFVMEHKNKIIIFVGSLDNFSFDGEIYKINADHKLVLDIKIEELLKRYYFRIAQRDLKGDTNNYNSKNYWKNVANGNYNIYSSEYIIKECKKYNEWHKKNGYVFMSDEKIIKYIKKILNNS